MFLATCTAAAQQLLSFSRVSFSTAVRINSEQPAPRAPCVPLSINRSSLQTYATNRAVYMQQALARKFGGL